MMLSSSGTLLSSESNLALAQAWLFAQDGMHGDRLQLASWKTAYLRRAFSHGQLLHTLICWSSCPDLFLQKSYCSMQTCGEELIMQRLHLHWAVGCISTLYR